LVSDQYKIRQQHRGSALSFSRHSVRPLLNHVMNSKYTERRLRFFFSLFFALLCFAFSEIKVQQVLIFLCALALARTPGYSANLKEAFSQIWPVGGLGLQPLLLSVLAEVSFLDDADSPPPPSLLPSSSSSMTSSTWRSRADSSSSFTWADCAER